MKAYATFLLIVFVGCLVYLVASDPQPSGGACPHGYVPEFTYYTDGGPSNSIIRVTAECIPLDSTERGE